MGMVLSDGIWLIPVAGHLEILESLASTDQGHTSIAVDDAVANGRARRTPYGTQSGADGVSDFFQWLANAGVQEARDFDGHTRHDEPFLI